MKNLLLSALHEIQNLRRRNEILSAKVEMIDLFACVLHTTPAGRNLGATVDVAWQLREEIDRINTEVDDTAPQQQPRNPT